MSSPIKPRKWYQIRWFQDYDTPEERKLIIKLDLLIVPYVFLAYWVKYIDQANINNAYVAGLKEDLGFKGNELVRLQTLYILGAVLGQLPFMYLFTKIPMYYLIPFLDIGWGIFTLLQYRVQSFAELAAYRFLVGWFEAAFFPAIHYIFGSWYRGDEIGRRGGFFYVGLTLGTLTAALIQSAASSQLDGVHGLAGWRWMYIICAIITIPVGILGFFVLPGTPDKPNKWLLKDHDVKLAKERLLRAGHKVEGSVTIQTFIKVAKSPRVWALLLLDIFFWNGSINTSTGGYLLWLKSLKRYSPARINRLGAISPAIGIFYTLAICFTSDLILGPAWAITVSHVWNAIGLIILSIWTVPESALWFAFMTTYSAVAMSSVLYGWINSQLSYSPAERSVALVFANTLAQSTTAWTPLLVFKTIEAPRFHKGYPFVLANSVCLIVLAHIINFYVKKRKSKTTSQSDDESGASIQETTYQVPQKTIPAADGPA
ncbi:MFS general substrate transporter [Cucurbitaria berberidis CBS 394.84]|uniref:MFS general substrate transporter n=1 Tax=Cucurbitaria berberidis CBS 394.84 TaxID=1168544 RepID=A0A9P4GLG1_9PLEO|nr:MFS general substrate transporter [Cucurbitaria berberidis CBS 394.84]KAF1847832.1 MFS general substrate transporter [Cucurbitaria berberidis CBS 394.84]